MVPSDKSALSRSSNRQLRVTVIIVMLSFLLILYIIIAHGGQQSLRYRGKVAVVYAHPTFHEEVVSSISCALHDMGYSVFIYVGSGLNILGMTLPYSDVRKENSEKFYGKCISQWESLSYPAITSTIYHYVYKPDIMVFITYPMKLTGFILDGQAISIIKKLVEDKSNTPVVLVTHHPHDIINVFDPGDPVHSILPINQTTFMFLGEHTEAQAQKMLKENRTVHVDKDYVQQVKTKHLYPVLPLEYIPKANDGSDVLRQRPTFAMQGNFGGTHGHKKDPRGVVDCLRHIETNYTSDLSIDFIGHLLEPIEVGRLKNGDIRFLSGLDHPHFYAAIANAKFLVFGTTAESYFTTAASSSVPAALITHVPLVTSTKFLDLYPCLRDSKIHRLITRDLECDAMAAALSLTDDQYRQAKEEIHHCSDYFWNDAKIKLSSVISK